MAQYHDLGRVVATAAAAAELSPALMTQLLDRHSAGDWGDLGADDLAANDEAASTDEGRLFSSYKTPENGKVWIITDLGGTDGRLTTVLFPADY